MKCYFKHSSDSHTVKVLHHVSLKTGHFNLKDKSFCVKHCFIEQYKQGLSADSLLSCFIYAGNQSKPLCFYVQKPLSAMFLYVFLLDLIATEFGPN